jgi:two-component system LytT family response regulator
MPELRVVIVDDEPLVRSGLRSLLKQESDVTVVGEARNGVEALATIAASAPDLVFLDVQMPGMDGFEVLAGLPAASRPSIIFVTAFDGYAIRAFDVHAVDYLLKPFDAPRFALALDRVRTRRARSAPPDDARWEALLAQLRSPVRYADRLLLKDDGSVIVVLVSDIYWIEASGNYVQVHARAARYRVRQTIKTLEAQLDPVRFARSHRSAIVNLDRVRSLDPMAAGEYVITLSTGDKVALSRGYRDRFREQLQGRATQRHLPAL